MNTPHSVSRKENRKASSGLVLPIQVNLLVRMSTTGRKCAALCSRTLELMPSAATTRSAPATSSRPVISWRNSIVTPSERARVLQQHQQGAAGAAAEAVAADAVGGALVADLDVLPVGELAGDRLEARAVVALEGFQGLVAEHDAEAERIVGAVALVDGDVVRRVRHASSGWRNKGRPGRRREWLSSSQPPRFAETQGLGAKVRSCNGAPRGFQPLT